MSISSESNVICRGLDEFCLPAVLMHVGSDRFLAWNRNFLEAPGCGPEELRLLPVSELVVFGPSSPADIAECEESPAPVHLDPCTVRNIDTGRMLPGHAFRREDGYIFIMLDPGGIDSSRGTLAGAVLAGQQQERERVQKALHATVAQQLVVIQFAVEALKTAIQSGHKPTVVEVDRLVELLKEMGDSIRVLTATS